MSPVKLCLAAALSLSTPVLAQTFVSGIAHSPTGAATLGPATDRRLTVSNLGSSGQDGVSIALNSAWGGSAAINLGELCATTRRTSLKWKEANNWEQVRMGFAGMGNGQCRLDCDFSGLPASSYTCTLFSTTGQPIPIAQPSGIIIRPHANSDGSPSQVKVSVHHGGRPRPHAQGHVQVGGCAFSAGATVTVGNASYEVTSIALIPQPTSPPTPPRDLATLEITSSMPSITVSDAEISSFSWGAPGDGKPLSGGGTGRVAAWGVGQAHITEECGDTGDCSGPARRIRVSNIGSSGQDGVSLDLGSIRHGTTCQMDCNPGFSVASSKHEIKYEKVGHVSILRREVSPSSTPTTQTVRMDFTGAGATQFQITLLSPTGGVLGDTVLNNWTPVVIDRPFPIRTSGSPVRMTEFLAIPGDVTCPGLGTIHTVASIVYRPITNVGINELIPDTVLHTFTNCTSPTVHLDVIPSLNVQGVPMTPTGATTVTPLNNNTLAITNLGSSAQDGVEVALGSSGGGFSYDATSFLQTPGSSITITRDPNDCRYPSRTVSESGGMVTHHLDYTCVGATSLTIQELDATGSVVNTITSPGATTNYTYQPNLSCPPGMQLMFGMQTVKLCNTCPWVDVYGWYCGSQFYSFNRTVIVTPEVPAGTPIPPIESLNVAACCKLGFGVIVVGGEDPKRVVQAWGSGNAQLSTACPTGAVCPGGDQLQVEGLSAAGTDGVVINIPPGSSDACMERKPGCCHGHVTILKFHDDAGQSFNLTEVDAAVGENIQLLPDFSSQGATEVRIRTRDQFGNVQSSVIVPNHTPISFPKIRDWVKNCYDGKECRYSAGGDTTLHFSPVNPAIARPAPTRHEITSTGDSFSLRDIQVTYPPLCGSSDFNGDGDYGTDADIESFFACLGGDCCPTCFSGGSDFNADGDYGTDADIEAFFRVLGGGPC